MSTVTALLTNKAYGYPIRGARRRRKPTILACLHQTANAKATAIQERTYANRAGSPGPSATAYIDRDGTIVRAIDPTKYAAWSQGDVASPNTKIPTIAAAVASGVNMMGCGLRARGRIKLEWSVWSGREEFHRHV